MKNIEDSVGEITLKLKDRGVSANVLVKAEGLTRKKKLRVVVSDLSQEESKRSCTIINETVLDVVGYGTSSTNYKDGTLQFGYSPLREEEPKKETRYQAAGCN
jgi:hypothetical protein